MVCKKEDLAVELDRDLERRIVNYLYTRQVSVARAISVQADNGTVTLRGEVFSFYQKQLCISCSRRVAGVLGLVDEIEVARIEAEALVSG